MPPVWLRLNVFNLYLHEISGRCSSSRRLAHAIKSAGYDAIHTLDMPNGNASTDTEINDLSINEQRAVITKDADFVDSFVLSQRPYKLLLISTGNITNADLQALFMPQLAAIADAFQSSNFVELTRTTLIIHT